MSHPGPEQSCKGDELERQEYGKERHQKNWSGSKFQVCIVKLTDFRELTLSVMGRQPCSSFSISRCKPQVQVELRTSTTRVFVFFSPDWLVTWAQLPFKVKQMSAHLTDVLSPLLLPHLPQVCQPQLLSALQSPACIHLSPSHHRSLK